VTFFPALVTKAGLLEKLGRADEAAAVIKSALPFGTAVQLQQLGRQLLTTKKTKAALEVFQFSYNKQPNLFITLTGMARGLSADGENAKALEFAGKALLLAPNEASKLAVEAMIKKLQAGKDIN
jgi:tetratricopeptide (TPR) repeat protein